MKVKNKLFSGIVLAFVAMFLVLCVGSPGIVFASASSDINCPNIYKEVATNFFEAQYEERGMDYNEISVALETDLYSSEEEVVAKVIVIERDDTYDYVVLNLATAEIDEFAFDDQAAIDKFDDKIYYTGVMNYYVKDADEYRSCGDDVSYSENEFKKISSWINEEYEQFKENASKIYRSDNNPLPNPTKNGWNGFYTWSEIRDFNNDNDYKNTEWGYLSGVGLNGTGSIGFIDQNDFNNHFGTTNACGPTALTNMFIWFQYRNIANSDGKVNALLNNDPYDTFDRFRVLVGHTNADGTSRSKYASALKTYAKEQGYNYEIDTGVDTYDEFKESIDAGKPVLTSIDLSDWGGHAVVTVGYERFTHEYTENHSFLWWSWTTTEYEYTNYLRVIDGWSTSNSSRYIDLKGYWDTVTGRSFLIKS